MFCPKKALVALLLPPLAVAGPNCPPLGPVYPKPARWRDSPTMQTALDNLAATLTWWDANDSPAVRANTTSYSIEVFSASAEEPLLFSWHHTAKSLAEAGEAAEERRRRNASDVVEGVFAAGPDAVYRLGSLTKVFTVYTWLAQDGDAKWNDPITKYVPELARAVAEGKARQDPVGHVNWEEVTVGALAGQTSGAIRDYGLMGEITQELGRDLAVDLGFPPLNDSDPTLPPCGLWPQCNRTQFFEGLLRAPPSFAASATPAYTNTGYQILAYALEAIKGKSFEEMMHESIFRPLGLKHTYYRNAPASEGIIPGERAESGWDYQLGDENPAGNMYSSVSDLSALGRSILRSTLLPPAVTRRWLKPAAMSSELIAGVGSPWGVRRIVVPYANGKRVVDAFNKAGRIGYYSALLVLLPDYDVGFSVMIAGDEIPGNTNFNLADILGGFLVPALEAAGREQAAARYGGEYADKARNASLRIAAHEDRPGLGIEAWISNGTDMRTVAVVLQSGYSPVDPSVRLYPAGLETVRPDGSRRVAFKAVFEDLNLPARPDSMFSTDCGTWVSFTAVTYGTRPLDQFVFELDPEGRVVSVENLALRAVLKKKQQ
ncbi:hypothetical protein VTJ83DRAFT_101 [Remersonia thermophila]|uniref:Beta-lactamase-related domain-containing protein n=1 Tax=Remersonia thermophila TaxID=72144 RepID=A0ABR4DK62_9PEZI